MRASSILRPLRRDRPWWGIAVGAVLFGIALAARWTLGGLAEGFGPMLLLPSILLTGVLGGIRVGLATAAISVLVAWTWFFPPYGTFRLEARHIVTIVTFVFMAMLELYVVRVLKVAIDDLSAARERSATMFRELQHRVANNLQVVAGVLYLERHKLDRGDPAARALERAQERLDLMVRVHRGLNNPTVLDHTLQPYLQGLGDDLIHASNTPTVRLKVVAAPIVLDVERLMSLSMIVAEAITNALKYAFCGRGDGAIDVELTTHGRACLLVIRDDGPGFPPITTKNNAASLGQDIVKSLVSQLNGNLSVENAPGATIRVTFPI